MLAELTMRIEVDLGEVTINSLRKLKSRHR
jgi:hypothetical protein